MKRKNKSPIEKYKIDVTVKYKPFLSLDIKFPKGKISDTPRERFWEGGIKNGVLSLGYVCPMESEK